MKRALILDDFKFLIRFVEGVLELAALIAVFWLVCCVYGGQAFSPFKLNLLMAVYGGLVAAVFLLCDCFSYGHSKLADMVVSQWIGVAIVNVLMYFVLCAVSGRMVRVWPVAEVLLIDLGLTLVCAYLYTCLLYTSPSPRD